MEFPDDVRDIEGQITWGLDQLKENGADLLKEAGFDDAAKAFNLEKLGAAAEALRARLGEDPGLLGKAIDQRLINA